jgi:RNA polymerase sigma-70 factor (ECF subfamily)
MLQREEVHATGSDQTLASVYASERDRLWRALVGFTRDEHVASDAVAEAFAQALGRGSEVRDASAWVWRAAFRIAAGELKRRRREVGPPAGAFTVPPIDPRVAALTEALARLPTRQRAVLILFHYAGFQAREIAERLGSTRGAVQMALIRGRRRLRELLEEDDDEA